MKFKTIPGPIHGLEHRFLPHSHHLSTPRSSPFLRLSGDLTPATFSPTFCSPHLSTLFSNSCTSSPSTSSSPSHFPTDPTFPNYPTRCSSHPFTVCSLITTKTRTEPQIKERGKFRAGPSARSGTSKVARSQARSADHKVPLRQQIRVVRRVMGRDQVD